MTCFEVLKDLYKHDGDFGKIWVEYESGVSKHFIVLKGYLFKENHLCIPQGSLREAIMFEAHNGVFGRHFRRDKTFNVIEDNFFWQKMERDATRFIQRCRICHMLNHMVIIQVYTLHFW